MNTSDVLNRAADLIESDGWIQGPDGWGGRRGTSLCLEGAIAAAEGLDNWEMYGCPSYRAVADYLDRQPLPLAAPIKDSLWQWNDAEGRTATEVVEVLRACALIEAAREDRERLEERLWAKVDKSGECWVFQGALSDGYGSLLVGRQGALAHRLSYELLVGPVPKGRVLDHLCRNRACVRPEHLEPVTVAENNRRGNGGWNLVNHETCRQGLHPWPDSARTFGDGSSRCQDCHQERMARRVAKRSAERAAVRAAKETDVRVVSPCVAVSA